MEKTISLFRKSFLQVTLLCLAMILIIKLVPVIFGVILTGELPNIAILAQDTLFSLLASLLFVQVMPLVITIFFGEWLYTRSFNSHQIFKMVWGEFLKWFSMSSLILISTSYIFRNNNNFRPFIIAVMISVELYLAIILVGNNNVSSKILKTFIPVILSIVFVNYLSIDVIYSNRDYISLAIWITYLVFCYISVFNYNGDIELNAPGNINDEQKSISNTWIFSKELSSKKIHLKKQNGIFKAFSEFIILTRQTYNSYTKILVLFLSIILLVLITGLLQRTFSNNTEDNTSFISSMAEISCGLLTFYVLVIAFFNPKYFLLSKEEFLLSRPVSRAKIYFYNFLNQFIFISAISFLIYIIARSNGYHELFYSNSQDFYDQTKNIPVNYFYNFNHLVFIGLALWIIIAGEVGIFVLIGLLIVETTFPIFDQTGLQSLSYSFLINLNTSGIFSISLWVTAIFFRLWDYNNFRKKEIGFGKGFKNLFKEINKSYSIPILTMLSVVLVTAYTNPFTKFLNTFTDAGYKAKFISDDVLSAIFLKFDTPMNLAIKAFLKDPYNKNNGIEIAKAYLHKGTYIYTESYASAGKNSLIVKGYIDNNSINIAKYWINNYKKDISNYDTHYFNALIELKQYKYEEAIKESEAIKNIKNKESLMQLAYLYNHELYYKKAIDVYKQLGDLSKDDKADSFNKIGDIYWKSGLYEQALKAYYQAAVITNTSIPIRNYYSNGLCKDLDKIKKERNNYIYLASIKETLDFCDNTYISSKSNNFRKYNSSYYFPKNDIYPMYFFERSDKGNFYLNSNKLDQAIDYYKLDARGVSNNYRTSTYGDLALAYLKKNELKNAHETVEKGLKEKIENDVYYNNIFRTKYDYKLYLLDMRLNKSNTKLSIARKLLLSAPDVNKVWQEINKIFANNPEKINNLQALKVNYDNLYNYFSKTHDNYATNLRSVEKTQFIIYRLGNEKNKVKGIKKLELEISKL